MAQTRAQVREAAQAAASQAAAAAAEAAALAAAVPPEAAPACLRLTAPYGYMTDADPPVMRFWQAGFVVTDPDDVADLWARFAPAEECALPAPADAPEIAPVPAPVAPAIPDGLPPIPESDPLPDQPPVIGS